MSLNELISALPTVILSTIICIEIFLKLPIFGHLSKIRGYSSRSIGVVKAKKISDHWKEKVLPVYSRKILTYSLLLVCDLLVLLIAYMVPYGIFGMAFGGGSFYEVSQTLYRYELQIVILSCCVVYAMVRRKFKAAPKEDDHSDYTMSSKLLHQLGLGSSTIKEIAFDVDCMFAPSEKKLAKPIVQPVYVTGLARAGTTILLETLYKTGVFSSLTYRDMPFITAPCLWSRLSGNHRRFSELKERAHGDRLFVNYDSPEAFEEVFWKTFSKKQYIHDSYLEPWGKPDDDLIKKYRKYIGNIIAKENGNGMDRYLAKNNNNLLRIDTIREAFPDAVIIVPFRNPSDHINSLQIQHKRFLAMQQEDPFVLKYMNWLGHFEFGNNIKPFKFSETDVPASEEFYFKPEYWYSYWQSVYDYLIKAHSSKVIFFDYNYFCQHPQGIFNRLESVLCIEENSMTALVDSIQPAKKYDSPASEVIPPGVNNTYQKLRDLSLKK